MKAKIATAIIFLCSALLIGWVFLSLQPGDRPTPTAAILSALASLVASEEVFLRPRFSYWLGMVSGFVGLYWFSRIEFRYFPALNSWIAFNLPDGNPQISSDVFLAKLKILLAVTVLISTVLCMTRLLPARWVVRKISVRERSWPALAVCFLVITLWYCLSASPYRIPLIADGVLSELTVLHVEKKGMQFHETAMSASRDGRVYVQRNDRRLFQYRFVVRDGAGMLPEAITARVSMWAKSPQVRELRTAPSGCTAEHECRGLVRPDRI